LIDVGVFTKVLVEGLVENTFDDGADIELIEKAVAVRVAGQFARVRNGGRQAQAKQGNQKRADRATLEFHITQMATVTHTKNPRGISCLC
jgi:hypothetical protein